MKRITLKLETMETSRIDLASLPIKVNERLDKLLIGADVIKNKDYKGIDYLVDKLIPKSTLCALVEKVILGRVLFFKTTCAYRSIWR